MKEIKARIIVKTYEKCQMFGIQYKYWWWPFWITYCIYDVTTSFEIVMRRLKDLYLEWNTGKLINTDIIEPNFQGYKEQYEKNIKNQ